MTSQENNDHKSDLLAAAAPVTTCWCGGALEASVHPLYGRCVSCGTLVLAQRLTAQQLKQFYTVDGYWRGHVVEKSGHPPIETRADNDFHDRIPVWHGLVEKHCPQAKSLIEIGCSHGGFLHYCREHGIPDVVGVEVDQATCDFAKRRFNLQHVQSGLFPDVKLPFAKFDVVSGFDVFEHFLEPVRALRAVAAMLKDDGIFIFQTPCYRGEAASWEQFRPEEHLFLFDDQNIHRVMAQAELEVTGIFPGYFRDDMFVVGRKRQVAKRILFVRTDAIGDNVLASTLLEPIKKKYADARLTVVCQEIVAPLYRACPHIDEIIAFDRTRVYQDTIYRSNLLARLQALRAELALTSVYSPESLTDLLTIGSGARRIVGLRGDTTNMTAEMHAQRSERYDQLVQSSGEWRPELSRHADFLAGLGIVMTAKLRPQLWLSAEDERFAEDFFREQAIKPERTLLLFAGASHPMRVFTRYAHALVGVCREYGLTVLAVGVAADREFSQDILDSVGAPAINLCGKLTLTQTAAVLKRCRVALGAETGTAHMASALAVPQVVVLGGGHFGRFMPYSASTRAVILPLDCYGCNWACRFATAHCVQDVAPVVIEQALRHALTVPSERSTLFVQGTSLWNPGAAGPSWQPFDKWLAAGTLDIIPVGPVPPAVAANWQAQILRHEQRFDEAETILTHARLLADRTACEKKPVCIDQAIDLNGEGERLFNAGDPAGAAAAFAQAIALHPGCVAAQNNLAVLAWQQGDAERALQYLVTAREMEPDNRDVVLNGVKMLAALAGKADALRLCRAYLATHSGDEELQSLAEQLAAGDASDQTPESPTESAAQTSPDAFKAIANESIDIRSSNGSFVDKREENGAGETSAMHFLREGNVAFAAGAIRESIQLFAQAWSADASIGNIDALNNQMVAYWSLTDVDKTLQFMAAALQIDSMNRSVVVNSGKILFVLNRFKEAAACFAGYLKAHPRDEEISKFLVTIESALKKYQDELAEGSDRNASVAREPESDVKVIDYSQPEFSASAPRISIVVPSFNQGKFIEATLGSILDQNYPNLELIVMDGGSTDKSVEIIKKYQDRISYWQSQSDAGQYWAINEGFRRSNGDIMAWINSDDKLHRDSLNAMASAFQQLPDVEWITGIPNVMSEAGAIQWVCHPLPVFSRAYYLQKKYDYPSFIQQEGTFWRRSLWEKAGATLRSEFKMAGDLELWTRFFRHAPLYTMDTFTGCFRQQKEQKTAVAMELYRAEANDILNEEIARAGKPNEPLISPVPPIRIRACEVRIEDVCDADSSGKNIQTITPAVNAAHDYRITAIVSTYNGERFLRGCLDDLEAQTIADQIEIIVVDSGSEQNERAIVEEYQGRYANIRYLRTEQRETVYAAWNRGVEAATAPYLTNANTDDRHRRDALERLAAELDARPDIALVYADSAVTRQENACYENVHVIGYFSWPAYDRAALFQTCYVGPQPMWRRDLHVKHGCFAAQYRSAGDYEFWLRIAAAEKFHHVPEVLGLYLTSPGSVENSNTALSAQESERARVSHWQDAWGARPQKSSSFFVPVTPAKALPAKRASADRQPLVSVIVPTCNRAALLKDALASLVAQDYANWEAVVVNDGGVDVESMALALDPRGRVRYFAHDTSRGPGAARNTGLSHARGEIICYLDDDDLFLESHLSTVVAALGASTPGFVYTDARYVREEIKGGERKLINTDTRYLHRDYSREHLLVTNYIPINTWAHHKACLEKGCLFDADLTSYEDWDFLLKMARHFTFKHIPSTTVEVRERDDCERVSARGSGKIAEAYREIYLRTEDLVDGDIRNRREQVLRELQPNVKSTATVDEVYQTWIGRNVLDETAAAHCSARALQWPATPVVHIIVDLEASQQSRLADTIDSLGGQLLSNWRLSVIATEPAPNSLFDELDILHWEVVPQGVDRSLALNNIATAVTADWVLLATAGDRLAAQFSFMLADYANRNPRWRLIYSDEDRLTRDGKRHDAHFKPDFNPDLLRSLPYMGASCALRRDLLLELGGYATCAGMRNYDSALRTFETAGAEAIGHIADVLYHRCDENIDEQKDAATIEYGRQMLSAHLQRQGLVTDVQNGLLPGRYFVDYQHSTQPLVSIVIPFTGQADVLKMCLTSLLEKTDYPNFEVLVIDTMTPEPQAPEYLQQLADDPRIRVLRYSQEYHFGPMNNRAAREARGDYLLLLNNDAVIIQANWLSRLMAHGQRTEVGIVGARLIYPNRSLQHAGIILGMGGQGVAEYAFTGLPMEAPGYLGRAQVVQNYSAVSADCMLIRKVLYFDAGGMDERHLTVLHNAVDLCLKVRQRGHAIVWTPFATLMRLGMKEAEDPKHLARTAGETDALIDAWLPQLARDAAFNRQLSLQSPSVWCAEPDLAVSAGDHSNERPRILGAGLGSDGSWQYRGVSPLHALQRHGHADCVIIPKYADRIRIPTVTELERIQAQSLLLYNTIHDDHLAALERYQRHSKVLRVFGLDDLASELPQKNPFRTQVYKDIKKRIRTALGLCDRLIVTTEPLGESFRGMIGDIRVVPNYLERSRWEGLRSQRRDGRKPRVGWAGALQHQGDLELIVDVVKETAAELDWIFLGMCPKEIRCLVAEFHPPVDFDNYPAKLASLDLDLAIAPLEYNRFNEAKSNLRLLEYGAMGWPVVCTNIHPYQNAPVERVPNNPRAWLNAIRARTADLDAAAAEGQRLKAWVLQNYMLEDHLEDWLNALSTGNVSSECQCAETETRSRIAGV